MLWWKYLRRIKLSFQWQTVVSDKLFRDNKNHFSKNKQQSLQLDMDKKKKDRKQ